MHTNSKQGDSLGSQKWENHLPLQQSLHPDLIRKKPPSMVYPHLSKIATLMSHPVYLVATIGAPRNHHALFVETDSFHPDPDFPRGR